MCCRPGLKAVYWGFDGHRHGGATRRRHAGPQVDPNTPAVEFDEVSLAFDDKVILDRVSFALPPAKMRIILGASGAGKSTILRLILGLLKPDGGRIRVFGEEVQDKKEADLMSIRANIRMVFQEARSSTRSPCGRMSATACSRRRRCRSARSTCGSRKCSATSGSANASACRQSCRAASAGASRSRGPHVQPEVLLYDEPTTGLDPITALTIDHEIIKLRDLEHVSSIIVTHQLRDAFFVATHAASGQGDDVQFTDVSDEHRDDTVFLMLKDGHIAFEGRADELRASDDEYLRSFLS